MTMQWPTQPRKISYEYWPANTHGDDTAECWRWTETLDGHTHTIVRKEYADLAEIAADFEEHWKFRIWLAKHPEHTARRSFDSSEWQSEMVEWSAQHGEERMEGLGQGQEG